MSLLKGVLTKKTESAEAGDTVSELNSAKHLQPARVYHTRLDSFSSLSSIYSADGGQADYRISGSVLLGIWHKNETLFAKVVKAKNLAGAKSGGLSDPYVKTYLLPDRSKLTKRKTTIQRKSNDPIYNEVLKTRLPRSDLTTTTLWLSVWDWDRFGRNLFLGEIRLGLSSSNLTNPVDHWYKLREKKYEPENEDKGKIVFSVMYSPYRDQKKGSLFIKIKEATGLLQMNPQGLTDSAVRVFLLPKRSPYTKKKTKCIKNTLDPVWNEDFEYKYVTLEELKSSRVLELSLWDYDRRGCNDFIGCVRLGPTPDETNSISKDWMDSTDSEAKHWAEMLAHPGEWVEACHELRPSIASRFSEYPRVQEESDFSLDSDEGGENDLDEEQDDSHGSNISLYSECEMRGDYPITGRLRVRLEYRKGNLRVHILNAEELAAADSNGFSDPYVKMYLLPDKSKHSKRKTDVKLKTLNPVFNETMQYEVEESKLSSHTLWFSVWDWDRFGKNEFLGEAKLPLMESNVNSPTQWYNLSDNIDVGDKASSLKTAPVVGKLTMSLKFEELGSKKGEIYGKLHIHIRNAKGLPNMDTHGYTDGFVKIFLLPTKTSKAQRKTEVVKDDLNPTWNEVFVYDKVTVEQLSSEHVLEVTVWDHDMLSSNDFVGGLRIGPAPKPSQTKEWMDSTIQEATHWEEMLSCPGEWVERCHTLRSSMNYRDISNPKPSAITDLSAKEEEMTSLHKPTILEPSVVPESPAKEKEPTCLHRGSMVITRGNRPQRTPSPRTHAKRTDHSYSEGIRPNHELQAVQNEDVHDPEVDSIAGASSASESSSRDETFKELTQLKSQSSTSFNSTEGPHVTDSEHPSKETVLELPSHSTETQEKESLAITPKLNEREERTSGQLIVSVMFQVISKKRRTKGNLCVKVKEALQLQCKTTDGIFAKCHMLPQRIFSNKKKTKVIKNTANPVWDQLYTFDKHFLDELVAERVLEITLWDNNDGSRLIYVGGLHLGPAPGASARRNVWMDSTGEEVKHWEAIFANPGEWVEVKHTLRPTMNC